MQSKPYTREELMGFVSIAKRKPGEWFAFSKSASLVSARSRVHQIKRSQKYVGIPLKFRAVETEDGAMVQYAYAGDEKIYQFLPHRMSDAAVLDLLDAIEKRRAFHIPAQALNILEG